MFCRRSTIRDQYSGVELKTPLLIPSFSSKGFPSPRPTGNSEIGHILEAAGEFLTDVYLISAYDIYHRHLPHPSDLSHKPEMIVVDSGGYEISTDFDYSIKSDIACVPKQWTPRYYTSVIDSWPNEIPAVFVSFDHPDIRKQFSDQVKDATLLFEPFPQHMKLFLLKPETKDQHTLKNAITSALGNVGQLARFDIVGVTEKELGSNMLDRMAQIAKLRSAMDAAQVPAPLHVFGALDPLSVCLYYIAGAEIFDGLTWLRYTYHEGVCMYTHNIGPLKYGLHVRDSLIRMRSLADNYYALQTLQQRLREFEATGSFAKLEPHAELLSNASDSLQTKLKG